MPPRITLITCVLLLYGCGKNVPRGTVEGTLLRQGKPLAQVVVVFLPMGSKDDVRKRAVGLTDSNGKYKLRDATQNQMVATGEYRIILQDNAIYSAERSEDGTILKMPPSKFPARYSNPLESPLQKQIVQGHQVIDLNVP